MPGNRLILLCCLEGSTPEDREGLFLFIALRWMQEPGGVMVWLAENIQACLRDFLAATASMARKRHLASIARGLCCFCLAPSIHKQILSIRLIRGKIEIQRTGASHQAWVIVVAPGEPFCTANGSNFALWLSVCQGQTRRAGRFRQASLLEWMNITTWQ